MAGRKKTPRLFVDGVYYLAKIYTPEGKRTSISFGHVDNRPEADVYAAFAKWLELYTQQPQKVLSFRSPYEAIEQILYPTRIITIGEFLDKYLLWAKKNMRPNKSGRENPDITKIKRACHFLASYHSWPVGNFGPDELKAAQKALVSYEYVSGKAKTVYHTWYQ